ncbi:MAG: cation:dicarboxylate symporter family transporter, partial [Mycoplasmatales bacterium]
MINLGSIMLIIIFILGLYVLQILKSKFKKKFNFRVLTALVVGLVFGGIIQLIFGTTSQSTTDLAIFASIFSGIYINLLKFIVIPLIVVSLVTAVVDAGEKSKLGKKLVQIIGFLLITVAIAAIIGITVGLIFNIDANALVSSAGMGSDVTDKATSLTEKQAMFEESNYAEIITNIIPTNLSFLVGAGDAAALSTVIFSLFLGYAILQVKKRKAEKVASFMSFMYSLKEVVLSLVREILKLTPFGIFALMTNFMATSNISSLGELIKFVLATYVAIIIMYIVHLLIITVQGISPIKYVKRTWSVLLFGFGSRSSMASIPLNVEAQVEKLGVEEGIANLSATLGASIGQNGCAGIYPAMVALMAAQIAGIQINLSWIIVLVIVIV